MAVCVPSSISYLDNISNGEKRVFSLLKQKLPEDYIIYYKVDINRDEVDFIILGPKLGVLVLEVRDWKITDILEVENNKLKISANQDIKDVRNPYTESIKYANNIINILEDNNYINYESENFLKENNILVSYGVVFTSIKSNQFKNSILTKTIDSDYIIFQDDLINLEKGQNKDDRLLKKLINISSSIHINSDIDKDSINKIRAALFPETVINENSQIIKVMDIEQEQVAKSLGSGHRVIRGVAGSGKSLILMCRARYLASKYPGKNILVLCYNKSFASYLADKLIYCNVTVMHFHKWVNKLNRQILRNSGPIYKDEDTNRVCLELLDKNYKLEKYDAILIDEGQDFQKNWLRLIVNSLKDRENGDLLLVSDGAQNLYNREYSFSDVGINARGRSRIFRRNYRNTRNILKVAESYIEVSKDNTNKEYENDFIIKPDEILRQGDPVVIYKYNFANEEKNFMREQLEALLLDYNPEEICILVGRNNQIYEYIREFNTLPIRFNNLKNENSIIRNMINISTIHSSKGFEFKVVLLVGLTDGVFSMDSNINQLIYVGMTRAVDKLYVSCKKESEIDSIIDKGIAKLNNSGEKINEIVTIVDEVSDKSNSYFGVPF